MLRVEAHSKSADEPDHRALTSLRRENPILFERHKVNKFNKTTIPTGSSSAAISKKKSLWTTFSAGAHWGCQCQSDSSSKIYFLKSLRAVREKRWGEKKEESYIMFLVLWRTGWEGKRSQRAGKAMVKRSRPLVLVQKGLSSHLLCCDHVEWNQV